MLEPTKAHQVGRSPGIQHRHTSFRRAHKQAPHIQRGGEGWVATASSLLILQVCRFSAESGVFIEIVAQDGLRALSRPWGAGPRSRLGVALHGHFGAKWYSLTHRRRRLRRPVRLLKPFHFAPQGLGPPSFFCLPAHCFFALLYAARASWSSSLSKGSTASSVLDKSWRPPLPRDPNNRRMSAATSSNFKLLRQLAIAVDSPWRDNPALFTGDIAKNCSAYSTPLSARKSRIPQRIHLWSVRRGGNA